MTVEHGQEMKMFWKWRETQWHECLALDPMVVKRGGGGGVTWREDGDLRVRVGALTRSSSQRYLARSQWSW